MHSVRSQSTYYHQSVNAQTGHHQNCPCLQCRNVQAWTNPPAEQRRRSVVNITFACDLCPQAFYDQNALQRHVNDAHKPRYLCTECNTGFHSSDEESRHFLRAHPDSTWRCSVDDCNYAGTRDVSRLVRHVKTRHPNYISDSLCLPPDYYEDWESEWAPALFNYNNMFSSDEEDDTENSSSYKSSERSHSPHSDSGTYVDGPGSPSASTAVGSPPPMHAYVGGHYPMQYQQFAAPGSQYPSGYRF